MVIRLKPGVQPQQAVAELSALLTEFVRQFKLETKITSRLLTGSDQAHFIGEEKTNTVA